MQAWIQAAANVLRELAAPVGARVRGPAPCQIARAKTLFRSEGELSPVAIFMWTKLLNKIGDIANHAENVGDQFRLFVAAS